MNTKLKYIGIVIVFILGLTICFSLIAQNKENPQQKNILSRSVDPWTSAQEISPEKLNEILKSNKSDKPVILMVGFDFLFDQGHIPGSIFAGTASSKTGMEQLKKTVKSYNKNKSLVVYCGCCPINHCPNVRPAFKTLKDMGYKNVKVLYIPKDFESDWQNKGYKVSSK